MCIWVVVCARDACRNQKRALELLKLELLEAVGHRTWVLGLDLGSLKEQ